MSGHGGGAYVRGRAVIIPPPADQPDGPPFLVVEVVINCTICGEQTLMIAGHHLRALVQVFQEFIDGEPELTEGGEIQVLPTRTYQVRVDPDDDPGDDPEQN